MHSKKIVRLAAVNWAVFVKGFLFQIFTVGIIVAVFSLIVSDFSWLSAAPSRRRGFWTRFPA